MGKFIPKRPEESGIWQEGSSGLRPGTSDYCREARHAQGQPPWAKADDAKNRFFRLFRYTFLILLLAVFGCHKPSSTKTYNVGFDPSWYPLQAPGLEKNLLAFSIELLVEVAKRENLELAVTQMSWDNILWGLKMNKYNAILSTMRPYTFYDKTFSFSEPYLMTGPALIVPKGSKIKSLSQMKGKEIGVVRGSSGALLLQTTPGVLMQGYDTIAQTLAALVDQQIEGAVVEVLVGQDYVRNLYHDQLVVASTALNEEGLRLVTLFQADDSLRKRFNQGLENLKKSGDYDKLLKKWGLSPDGTPIADLDRELNLLLNENSLSFFR